MSDDRRIAVAVREPAEIDILSSERTEYVERREADVNTVEIERIRAAPLLGIAQAQAAPALEEAKAKRESAAADARIRALSTWQEWALKAGLGTAFTVAALGQSSPIKDNLFWGAIAVGVVTQGKPVLEGFGSLLSAAAKWMQTPKP